LKYKRYGKSPSEAEIKAHAECLKKDLHACPKGHEMKYQHGSSGKDDAGNPKLFHYCDGCNRKLGNMSTPQTSQ